MATHQFSFEGCLYTVTGRDDGGVSITPPQGSVAVTGAMLTEILRLAAEKNYLSVLLRKERARSKELEEMLDEVSEIEA